MKTEKFEPKPQEKKKLKTNKNKKSEVGCALNPIMQ